MTFYHFGKKGEEYFIDEYTQRPGSSELEKVHRIYDDFATALCFTIHQSWDSQDIAPVFTKETFEKGENNISTYQRGLVGKIENAYKALAIVRTASSRPYSSLRLSTDGERPSVPHTESQKT
jgi:hypothetical protein